MIVLKTMSWSNVFSYGENNTINFSENKLTQLVGKNGFGKTSIALILEEVLFNKNTKGIKKANILNRYSKKKEYSITLTFSKGTTEYTINTVRGTTQKVTLLENGNDISAHTSTATYKMIEQIVGLDHKTFAQIVYQSSSTSLEFLRSPDTARKKFLIELLNLGRYTKIGEHFKKEVSKLSKDLSEVSGKTDTVQRWITKYSKEDLTIKPKIPVPEIDEGLISEASQLRVTISNIDSINKKIVQNNTYKAMLDSIVLAPVVNRDIIDISEDITAQADSNKTIRDAKALITKLRHLDAVCPTCIQNVDSSKVENVIAEQNHIIQRHTTLSEIHTENIIEANRNNAEIKEAKELQEAWEKYHMLYDSTLDTECLDKDTLEANLSTVEDKIKKISDSILEASNKNEVIEGHNNKVELLTTQLKDMREELLVLQKAEGEINHRLSLLNILNKTFSTTGLVAYKIEALVIDLQDLSNDYLTELSAGRFQISFQISGSDKLNVVITDNGNDVDIQALSAGETARVNVAVLLAIRKLMNSLFEEARINLLFLDETVATLDADGRERLVEILLDETELNTIIVSHEFTHPLLEKIIVEKENNISRITE